MANRFTTKIDELFPKYGKDTDKYIFLGCCYKGDDDGGCSEYNYFYITDLMEKLENFDDDKGVLDPYPYDNDKDVAAMARYKSFEEEFKAFHDELRSAFPNFFKPDYEGTNCYWNRCYFATRDHKLFQVTTSERNWDPKDHPPEKIINLDNMSDDAVDMNTDKEILDSIAESLHLVKLNLKNLKTDKGRIKAYETIKKTADAYLKTIQKKGK